MMIEGQMSFSKWFVYEPGVMEYNAFHRLQERLVKARQNKQLANDCLILLEHLPVFTIGRRGRGENLLVDEDFLVSRNIGIVSTRRGGEITFHALGQLMGYLLVDLRSNDLTIERFLFMIEDVLIRVAGDFRVECRRDPKNRGVWVGEAKLASIGIAVSRGIAFHGFALNANNDLRPFGWINPCGLKGVPMTSLFNEIKIPIDMEMLRISVKKHVSSIFNAELTALPEISPDFLQF